MKDNFGRQLSKEEMGRIGTGYNFSSTGINCEGKLVRMDERRKDLYLKTRIINRSKR